MHTHTHTHTHYMFEALFSTKLQQIAKTIDHLRMQPIFAYFFCCKLQQACNNY